MLRTRTLAHSWATVLSFISRVIAFLFLLTRIRRHRWAFYRHDGIQKHKTQYPENAGNAVQRRVLVVYCLAAWDLWLPATAQHHKSVSYRISLAQEKIKDEIKIPSRISTECKSLSHHLKVEKSYRTVCILQN